MLDKAQSLLILSRQLDHPGMRGKRRAVLISRLLQLSRELAIDVVEAIPPARPRRVLH